MAILSYKKIDHIAITERSPLLALPIIRGAVGLIDMMYLGIKTLNWSAEIAMMDEEIKTKGSVPAKKKKKGGGAIATGLTLVVALLLGVGLFFALPLFVASKLFAVEQTGSGIQSCCRRNTDVSFAGIYACYFYDGGCQTIVSLSWSRT